MHVNFFLFFLFLSSTASFAENCSTCQPVGLKNNSSVLTSFVADSLFAVSSAQRQIATESDIDTICKGQLLPLKGQDFDKKSKSIELLQLLNNAKVPSGIHRAAIDALTGCLCNDDPQVLKSLLLLLINNSINAENKKNILVGFNRLLSMGKSCYAENQRNLLTEFSAEQIITALDVKNHVNNDLIVPYYYIIEFNMNLKNTTPRVVRALKIGLKSPDINQSGSALGVLMNHDYCDKEIFCSVRDIRKKIELEKMPSNRLYFVSTAHILSSCAEILKIEDQDQFVCK